MKALIDLINKNKFSDDNGNEAVFISGEQMAKLSYLINTESTIKPLDLFTFTFMRHGEDQSFINDCLKALYIDDEIVRFEVLNGVCEGNKYTRNLNSTELKKLPDNFLHL
tara:strand:- start:718 stop:1047 length:330 start_codon:yes stop_codon:yes gene_type:complete